ncbi:hypothetical protein ACFVEN_03295 [Streptomyces sp. NPDC057681]|uniref:hypothetical protein n=1 Tax=Streptomyces sp. NPDC057681 TaxID=3346209 RepID=UPI0036BBBA49
MLTRAGFSGPQRDVVPGGQPLERTADDPVAGVFSMSFSAPHLFGMRRDAFEADLRRLLREASPAGRFSERRPSTEIVVWRNAPAEHALSWTDSRISGNEWCGEHTGCRPGVIAFRRWPDLA